MRAVVEAYGNTEATDEDVAMKNGAERLAVPVAVRREPFQVRIMLLAETPVRSRPIVPVFVIVPPVRPLFVATEVTVPPDDVVRHVPFTAKHPPYGRLMPARVEVAVEEAYVNETAPANDVEAVFVNLLAPENVLLSASNVDEAAPERDVR